MITELLDTAILAALSAGQNVLEIYNGKDYGIEFKSDNTPVTLADKRSHKIILSFLEQTNIPVLSEEGASIDFDDRKNWEYYWCIDPIDGTKEFINRQDDFTINIALIKNHVPVLGVIYIPVFKDLYIAEAGFGAYKAEKMDIGLYENKGFAYLISNFKKLPFSRFDDTFVIAVSKSHQPSELLEYIDTLRKNHSKVRLEKRGSSLKFCLVAEGAVDMYPRVGRTMEWDTAAGQAIVTIAGGSVIDMHSENTMIYNKKSLANPDFIVRKNNILL